MATRKLEHGEQLVAACPGARQISGLLRLQPRADETVEVNPLVPDGWAYFCLDHVRYHGRWLTVLYDKTGQHFSQGQGLRLFCDGKLMASRDRLGRLTGILPTAK